tara:strand:+ start:113 stop:646 length:534 start_codon:yes stop_codon:yes gene_type:complete
MKKKFGILFRISGLPGSGKTEVAKLLHPKINKIFGPSVIWSGDDLRKIYNNKSYSLKERNIFGCQNIGLIKLINSQKINVIFATVGLSTAIRKKFKKEIPNYIEIIIKADIKDLQKRNAREFYNNNSKNVWGKDIKVEYPKKPDVAIVNDFKKDLVYMEKYILKNLIKLKKLQSFMI